MKVLFTGRCLIIGDDRFESSWKALARDAHGIIFVFDPEKESHARQLEVRNKLSFFTGKEALAFSAFLTF